MSVDPDDQTPGAIKQTGARVVSYGAPVLPGAMFLLAYFEDGTPVLGLPGCVMYAAATIFDLVLPRVAAGVELTRAGYHPDGGRRPVPGLPGMHLSQLRVWKRSLTMRKQIELEQAAELVCAALHPLEGEEQAGLLQSMGRVLARDMIEPAAQPAL